MAQVRRGRLKRLDEFFDEQPLFFVTLCSHERKLLLAHATIHESFRAFCAVAEKRDYLVGRYVIMPDHIHLFILPPSPDKLSSWIKSLKNSMSKTLRFQGHQAPHWQKDFFDHVLRSTQSYAEKWEYVRHNPVHAGLVENAENWPDQGEFAQFFY